MLYTLMQPSQSILAHFLHTKRKPRIYDLSQTHSPPLIPPVLVSIIPLIPPVLVSIIYFLSVWNGLLWTLHIKKSHIICGCLLLTSFICMLPSFIHVVAYVSSSFFS